MFTSRQNQQNLPAAGALAAGGGVVAYTPSELCSKDIVMTMFLKPMCTCSQGHAVVGQDNAKPVSTSLCTVHLQEGRRFVHLKFVLIYHVYVSNIT